jgi:hypothetical protein
MQRINLSTGSLDVLANRLLRLTFQEWIGAWRKGEHIPRVELQVSDAGQRLNFEFEAALSLRKRGHFKVLDGTGADSRDFLLDQELDELEWQEPFIIIEFEIDPEWLPNWWSELYMYLSDCIRHELEHITQGGELIGNYRSGKPTADDMELRELIKLGILEPHHYLLLPKEIDANLQGLRFEAKKRREKIGVIVDKYLDSQTYLDERTRSEVLQVWRDRAQKIGGIPKF